MTQTNLLFILSIFWFRLFLVVHLQQPFAFHPRQKYLLKMGHHKQYLNYKMETECKQVHITFSETKVLDSVVKNKFTIESIFAQNYSFMLNGY